ncbi:hypothetical protein HDU97_008940 [Phlyctochytrium planicorne]|nr:hypothetical protein HDU97_008940 [Phlyctochytrium planicorne]
MAGIVVVVWNGVPLLPTELRSDVLRVCYSMVGFGLLVLALTVVAALENWRDRLFPVEAVIDWEELIREARICVLEGDELDVRTATWDPKSYVDLFQNEVVLDLVVLDEESNEEGIFVPYTRFYT